MPLTVLDKVNTLYRHQLAGVGRTADSRQSVYNKDFNAEDRSDKRHMKNVYAARMIDSVIDTY